jgi:hypothetical protein
MPKYLAYGTKKETPLRMTRKQSRRRVFMVNAKLTKLRRKQKLLQNRQNRELLESDQQED